MDIRARLGLVGLFLILSASAWAAQPATSPTFTVTPRGRELLSASLVFCEKNWDDRAAMVTSPGGVDPSPDDPRQHRVRETVWYALGLVLRNEPGDLVRAGRAIDAVLAQQFNAPGQRWDGTFRRGVEESDPPAKGAKMWEHYDPNWRQFVGTTLALILIRGGDRLPADLVARMERAIARAVEGELADKRLKPGYTNIALMHGFLWSWAGQRLGKADWVTNGEAWCQAVHQLWATHRAFDEYNSPTYYGVDLYGLALWREFGPTDKIRTLGAEMEAGLWRDIGDYYHAGLKNVCGPFDRSYGMDMRRYVALTGVWIGLVVPAELTPLPDPTKPMAHGHDFFCVPTYVALNLQVPAEAAASFRRFQGARQLNRPISGPRVATAWIGENLMLGGEITGNTRGANKATSQFHPATMHWRAPGDDVGWMRLFASPNCDAKAEAGLLTVTSAAPGDFTYRLCVRGLKNGESIEGSVDHAGPPRPGGDGRQGNPNASRQGLRRRDLQGRDAIRAACEGFPAMTSLRGNVFRWSALPSTRYRIPASPQAAR